MCPSYSEVTCIMYRVTKLKYYRCLWIFLIFLRLPCTTSSYSVNKVYEVCLGSTLKFECCVQGGGFTVWDFKPPCQTMKCEMTLRHSQFANSTKTTCCNEALQARSINHDNGYFTSELIFTITSSLFPNLSNAIIECRYDNGTAVNVVKNYNISFVRTKFTSMCEKPNMTVTVPSMMSNKKGSTLAAWLGTVITLVLIVAIVTLILIGFMVKKFKATSGERPISMSTTNFQSTETQQDSYNHLNFDRSLSIGNEAYRRCQSFTDEHRYSVVAYPQSTQNNSQNDINSQTEVLDLNSLLIKLEMSIDAKMWYTIGLEIGVPEDFLENLKSCEESECLIEVADYWLRNHPGKPSWSDIEKKVAKFATTADGNYDTLGIDVMLPPRPPRNKNEGQHKSTSNYCQEYD